MPTGVETNLQVSFWWYDHRWLLVGAVSLILAASLTSRLWGSYARTLARRNSQLLPGPNQVRTGRTRLDRLVSGVTRFLANTPLVAGTLIAAVLLVAALVPQALAPYGPQDRFPFMRTIGDELTVPPFAPDSRSLMGSDQDGRDILSRIIHGTRGTISICVAVTILRFLIGGVLGGIAGWRRGVVGNQMLALSEVSGSIPSLLFAYIFIIAIGPQLGFGVFVLGLGLTGWAELTNLVDGAVRRIRNESYMEGALALGSSTSHLVRRHILPNLAPQLLPATALELSAVLLILAELGFLGVILGLPPLGIIFQSIRTPFEPEWAGMLSGARAAIFYQSWQVMSPAMAFVVAILGFNLLGTGLREWLDPYQRRSA